jgi:DNA-binding NarL/FixJ family response regulator
MPESRECQSGFDTPVSAEPRAGARRVAPKYKLAGRVTQSSLTAREIEVLVLVSRGLRNKDIGLALYISEETVKGHIRSIPFKLDVEDRTRVAVLAAQRGIIHLD